MSLLKKIQSRREQEAAARSHTEKTELEILTDFAVRELQGKDVSEDDAGLADQILHAQNLSPSDYAELVSRVRRVVAATAAYEVDQELQAGRAERIAYGQRMIAESNALCNFWQKTVRKALTTNSELATRRRDATNDCPTAVKDGELIEPLQPLVEREKQRLRDIHAKARLADEAQAQEAFRAHLKVLGIEGMERPLFGDKTNEAAGR